MWHRVRACRSSFALDAGRLRSTALLGRRNLLTLAIETSCDDTSVAILDKESSSKATLLYHEKVTADNRVHRGIHPIIAQDSHQRSLYGLVAHSITYLPEADHTAPASQTVVSPGQMLRKKPDFISVTRGPGLYGSLATGLDTAKGLALAWQIPFVGVNHMQAHALTPRLVNALKGSDSAQPEFLTLLVSGGHTMLVRSRGLCDHAILASTTDIAIGDALDKIARSVLPPELLRGEDVMYARVLERFAFGENSQEMDYTAPPTREEELTKRESKWGWTLPITFRDSKQMAFSFSGLESSAQTICKRRGTQMGENERRCLGIEAMRIAFEHLASRVTFALQEMAKYGTDVQTLVVSGGVASNRFLKTVLKSYLAARNFPDVQLIFPPVSLCTDNAAMIAWAGTEMFEAKWATTGSAQPLRKWSIDPQQDGGILGAPCWTRLE